MYRVTVDEDKKTVRSQVICMARMLNFLIHPIKVLKVMLLEEAGDEDRRHVKEQVCIQLPVEVQGGTGIHNLLAEEVLRSCKVPVEFVRVLQEFRKEFGSCREHCDCSPPDNLNID